MKSKIMSIFPLFVLIILLISACDSFQVLVSPVPTKAVSIFPTLTNTRNTPIDPTATSLPRSVTLSQVELVLLNNGFIHHAELDGVGTCRVDGCKVYESISIGINAWAYLNGTLSLLITSGEDYNDITQDRTVTEVITQLFGDRVNAWLLDHRAAAMTANQDGIIDGYKIAIAYTDALGYKLTMIVITRS